MHIITTKNGLNLLPKIKPIIKEVIKVGKENISINIKNSNSNLSANYKDNFLMLILETYRIFSEDERNKIKKYYQEENDNLKYKKEIQKLLIDISTMIEKEESKTLGFGMNLQLSEKDIFSKLYYIVDKPLENYFFELLKYLKNNYGEIENIGNYIRIKDGKLYNFLEKYTELEAKINDFQNFTNNQKEIEDIFNNKIGQYAFVENQSTDDYKAFSSYITELKKHLNIYKEPNYEDIVCN